MEKPRAELLKGTLDLLVLKILEDKPTHGYGIARQIEEDTKDALRIEEGSLYPALYRMEGRGWITSEWGLTEHNRRAKYYRLTAKGRAQLQKEVSSWEYLVRTVGLVLNRNPS
jgi:transcriptional regulator